MIASRGVYRCEPLQLTICPYDIFAKLIPKTNNGYYMGIFNIAIVVPQIVTGLLLGVIYKYGFDQQAAKVVLMAGLFLITGAIFSYRNYVDNKPNPLLRFMKQLTVKFS
ncbi:MAG: hypothetical protein PSV35_04695 [bacterium]|nr:hypothetical protein [bacterium]